MTMKVLSKETLTKEIEYDSSDRVIKEIMTKMVEVEDYPAPEIIKNKKK